MQTDTIDERCMTLLGKTPLTTTELAKKVRLHRSSALYRLNRLKKLGRVRYTTGRKRAHVWSVVTSHRDNRQYVHTFRRHEFVHAYHCIFRAPRKSIVYAIEGYENIFYDLKHSSRSDIFQTHKMYRRKHITLKVIAHTRMLQLISVLDTHLVQSNMNRSIGLQLLPKPYLLGPSTIIATPKDIMFVNTQKRFSCVIREPNIVYMFYETLRQQFDLLDNHPDVQTLDFNQWHVEQLTQRNAS